MASFKGVFSRRTLLLCVVLFTVGVKGEQRFMRRSSSPSESSSDLLPDAADGALLAMNRSRSPLKSSRRLLSDAADGKDLSPIGAVTVPSNCSAGDNPCRICDCPNGVDPCTNYRNQCEADGCFWRRRGTGSRSSATRKQFEDCFPYITQLIIGGSVSTADYSTQADNGRVTRPDFMVTKHHTTSRRRSTPPHWTSCSSDDENDSTAAENCWAPFATSSQRFESLRGKLSSTDYDKIVMETMLQCEGAESLELEVYCGASGNGQAPVNADIKVFYNGVDQGFELGTECAANPAANLKVKKTGSTGWGSKVEIPINSNDAYPILRIELSRADAPTNPDHYQFDHRRRSPASIQVQATMREVPVNFDKCMQTKDYHGVCLQNLDIGKPLRSDHEQQKECLSGTDTTMEGCTAWRTCLLAGDTDFKDLLLRIVSASDMTPTDSLTEKHGMHKTITATAGTTTCTDDGTCADPLTFDIESFDCKCYDGIYDKTETELWTWLCNHDKVCGCWKQTHCSDDDLLQQRSREDVAVRSSLDDSLTSKCR